MNIEQLFVSRPEFETARLYLRKLELTDAPDFYSFASDPLLTEHVKWDYHQSIADTEAFLALLDQRFEARHSYNWAIIEKTSGGVIGRICCFLFDEDNDSMEFGYAVGRAYWGQGIGAEASEALIPYVFRELGVNRLEARCNEENIASERVMQKIGMTFEGLMRQQLKMDGGYKSQKLYAMLKSDWAEKEGSQRNDFGLI